MTISNVLQQDLEFIWEHFTERESLRGATILVTGCAGFIGYEWLHFFLHYAEPLGLRSIVGLDSLRLRRCAWLNRLKQKYDRKLIVIEEDIASCDLTRWASVLSDVDYVIHMASIASPVFYRRFPLATVDANIWGLRRLLEWFRNKPIKGFLFFSSSEIYGDPLPNDIPLAEETPGRVHCLGPRACYDESKRFGETLCEIFAREFGIPIVIVRPFNNYGPGMPLDDGRAPADFAHAVLTNQDIVLFSNGTPTRTFCYVADALVGYLKALVYGRFDYFNIGCEAPEISILDFARLFEQCGRVLLGYTGCVRFAASRETDYLKHNPQRRCPKIDKARMRLGFNPVVDLNEGINRFIKFLAEQQEGL